MTSTAPREAIDDEQPTHPTRTLLIQLVTRNTGMNVARLCHLAGISRGQARHHLHRLEKDAQIRLVKLGREAHYFPRSTPDSQFEVLARAQHGRAWMVLGEVLRHPGIVQTELAKRVGMSRKTLRPKLDNLVAAGLIEERLDGRLRRYLPGPYLGGDLQTALANADPERMARQPYVPPGH